MKKLSVFLAGEIGYNSLLAYVIYRYPDQLKGTSIAVLFVIPTLSIAAAAAIQWILQIAIREKFNRKYKDIGRVLYNMISFGFVFATYYASYVALEFFGKMPISFRTLVFISLISSLAHLMISSVPETISKMTEVIQEDEDER